MELIDSLKALGERVTRLKTQINTEEATKTAFILPFIQALGYDIFDPSEVIPEFTADIGLKKGEKVDYCIQKEGKPIIIVECKAWNAILDVHDSQLLRYFHVTNARFGLLTNGIIYRFYTDLDSANKMDTKPFLELNVCDIKEAAVAEVKKFAKQLFNEAEIVSTASDLRHTKEIRAVLNDELATPSEDFVKYLVNKIYPGRLTPKVVERFGPIVKKAANGLISDMISDRLKLALDTEQKEQKAVEDALTSAIVDMKERKVETTEAEREAFFIVKAILRDKIQADRITMRDNQTYMAILLDDNNRRPICRMYMNASKWYIAFIDASGKESKNLIDNLDSIFNFETQLNEAAARYTEKTHV